MGFVQEGESLINLRVDPGHFATLRVTKFRDDRLVCNDMDGT